MQPERVLPPEGDDCVLRLYVAGSTPHSSRAITNLKTSCEAHLKAGYVLTVVDLYEEPERGQDDDIAVTPTLIRRFPLPMRRLVGDLSDSERVLAVLHPLPALKAS